MGSGGTVRFRQLGRFARGAGCRRVGGITQVSCSCVCPAGVTSDTVTLLQPQTDHREGCLYYPRLPPRETEAQSREGTGPRSHTARDRACLSPLCCVTPKTPVSEMPHCAEPGPAGEQ